MDTISGAGQFWSDAWRWSSDESLTQAPNHISYKSNPWALKSIVDEDLCKEITSQGECLDLQSCHYTTTTSFTLLFENFENSLSISKFIVRRCSACCKRGCTDIMDCPSYQHPETIRSFTWSSLSSKNFEDSIYRVREQSHQQSSLDWKSFEADGNEKIWHQNFENE